MANTYTRLYIQFVFAVKNRQAQIQQSWKDELYRYITGIVRNHDSKMLAINGMADYIHLFIGYKPTGAIPDLIKDVKVASTVWIKEHKLTCQPFNRQEGYGAFANQRGLSLYSKPGGAPCQKGFRDEYLSFLKHVQVAYDDKYLFDFLDDQGSIAPQSMD